MKLLMFGAVFAALLSVSAQAQSLPGGPQEGDARLSVVVSGVTPQTGQVLLTVYDRSDFLKKPLRFARIPVLAARELAHSFFLPPGAYAVRAIYDEDANGKLNVNAFGLIDEPYAFSNGARGLVAPPSFDEAAFKLAPPFTEILVPLKN